MVNLAPLTQRRAGRKLFREYAGLYDYDHSFGPDNVGVYDWQVRFHHAGKDNPERLCMSANRTGKTRTSMAEVAIHATGEYPDWWDGRRFDKPVKVWTGAESTEDSRDIIQEALLGPRSDIGTGWLPKSRVIDWDKRQAGVTEVAETIFVKHITGGTSEITLKTYAQEARGWRGRSIDVCAVDELVPMDIYTEAQTRLIDRKGIMLVSFTPMEGPTEVVRHFMENNGQNGIFVINVTWDDAPHLDEAEKERLKNSYPEFERDARTKGIPLLGSGAIFTVDDKALAIPPFDIPNHWARVNGMDFGIDHPGAGVFCAHDRDSDTFYMYDGYKAAGQTPVYHAAAMKKHGLWIPHAWPHDGNKRDVDRGALVPLKDQYRRHGLRMMREHAHYKDDRGMSREAALIEMLEYMRTGRFKVFNTMTEWFEEKRLYHRKQGKVVALHDDLISASRYAFMMRRFAITKPKSSPTRRSPQRPIIGG